MAKIEGAAVSDLPGIPTLKRGRGRPCGIRPARTAAQRKADERARLRDLWWDTQASSAAVTAAREFLSRGAPASLYDACSLIAQLVLNPGRPDCREAAKLIRDAAKSADQVSCLDL